MNFHYIYTLLQAFKLLCKLIFKIAQSINQKSYPDKKQHLFIPNKIYDHIDNFENEN